MSATNITGTRTCSTRPTFDVTEFHDVTTIIVENLAIASDEPATDIENARIIQ